MFVAHARDSGPLSGATYAQRRQFRGSIVRRAPSRAGGASLWLEQLWTLVILNDPLAPCDDSRSQAFGILAVESNFDTR